MHPPRAAALTSRRSSCDSDSSPVRVGVFSAPSLRIAAVPVAIAMLVTLWFVFLGEPGVTGDEPHYFVMADGLVHDRTFDLRDAYTRRARRTASTARRCRRRT